MSTFPPPPPPAAPPPPAPFRRRRRSIFPGLLLIVLGAIFLIHRLDPGFAIGHIARFYWPLLFVIWGVAKLVDHFIAQNTGQEAAPLLSAGEFALLLLLIVVLMAFGIRDWTRERAPWLHLDIPGSRDRYSESRDVRPEDIPPGSRVRIETARGDITVTGTNGGQIRVSANESANDDSESAADTRMNQVEIVVEKSGDTYTVRPAHQSDSRGIITADLEVNLPKSASLALHTSHGDISVSGIDGAVDARTDNGDIEIHDIGSNLMADTAKGDVRVDRVAGNVELKGRGGEVEINDVGGNAIIDGAYVGSTAVRKVSGITTLAAPWAQISVAQITGRLEVDSGDIHVSGAGATRIQTHNKDIDIEDVAGPIDVSNSHGDVKVTLHQPPREPISITNDSGEVDLGMPSRSSFQISAYTRSGQAESDFNDPGLRTTGEEENGRLDGQVGNSNGAPIPRISIVTSYGTISLRKTS